MRKSFLLVSVLLLAAVTALAEDAPKKEEAPVAQVAVFAVPNLGDEAVVKDLTKALARQEGLVAAKADVEAGKFLVTFETAKTNPEQLAAIVTEVAPESKLESVQAAEAGAMAHDCGKCPSKATCGSAKKDHAEKSPS